MGNKSKKILYVIGLKYKDESSPFIPNEIKSSFPFKEKDFVVDSEVEFRIYFLKLSIHFSFDCFFSISSSFSSLNNIFRKN